ncbi:unnamed protein product, partial [Mesorhabditis belari]|uniref:Uncharacterized protein n=1 Tax=Mesorhabditis belari TaxID=2138241 RepID=A0AAF3FLU2_9BILA
MASRRCDQVQPMPCDCRMDHLRGTGNQCLFRCEAELISFTTDNGIPNLECSISANIYDINFRISMAQIGVFYDVIIKRPHPKEHTLCEGEWVEFFRILDKRESEQPTIRYEILDYQKIPSPTGWSMDGITINGLAKTNCSDTGSKHDIQMGSDRNVSILFNKLQWICGK